MTFEQHMELICDKLQRAGLVGGGAVSAWEFSRRKEIATVFAAAIFTPFDDNDATDEAGHKDTVLVVDVLTRSDFAVCFQEDGVQVSVRLSNDWFGCYLVFGETIFDLPGESQRQISEIRPFLTQFLRWLYGYLAEDEGHLLTEGENVDDVSLRTLAMAAHLNLRSEHLERLADYLNTRTWIYLIRDHDSGLVKIGRADDPTRRINQLRAESTLLPKPHSFEFLFYLLARPQVERELHREYADKRVRGEWFELTSDDIEAIRSRYRGQIAPPDSRESIPGLFNAIARLQRESLSSVGGGA